MRKDTLAILGALVLLVIHPSQSFIENACAKGNDQFCGRQNRGGEDNDIVIQAKEDAVKNNIGLTETRVILSRYHLGTENSRIYRERTSDKESSGLAQRRFARNAADTRIRREVDENRRIITTRDQRTERRQENRRFYERSTERSRLAVADNRMDERRFRVVRSLPDARRSISTRNVVKRSPRLNEDRSLSRETTTRRNADDSEEFFTRAVSVSRTESIDRRSDASSTESYRRCSTNSARLNTNRYRTASDNNRQLENRERRVLIERRNNIARQLVDTSRNDRSLERRNSIERRMVDTSRSVERRGERLVADSSRSDRTIERRVDTARNAERRNFDDAIRRVDNRNRQSENRIREQHRTLNDNTLETRREAVDRRERNDRSFRGYDRVQSRRIEADRRANERSTERFDERRREARLTNREAERRNSAAADRRSTDADRRSADITVNPMARNSRFERRSSDSEARLAKSTRDARVNQIESRETRNNADADRRIAEFSTVRFQRTIRLDDKPESTLYDDRIKFALSDIATQIVTTICICSLLFQIAEYGKNSKSTMKFFHHIQNYMPSIKAKCD